MFLVIVFSVLVLYFVHDYLSYCFMQGKKVGFSSFCQWWNGEIDRG